MWKKLIEELVRTGLREDEIADRIKASGVETTQASINRLKWGETKNPRYELGQALIKLHGDVCKSKRRLPKPQEARA